HFAAPTGTRFSDPQFAPGGWFLFVRCSTGEFRVWDLHTQKAALTGKVKSPPGGPLVEFAPDGRSVAWGDGTTIRVADLPSGETPPCLDGGGRNPGPGLRRRRDPGGGRRRRPRRLVVATRRRQAYPPGTALG